MEADFDEDGSVRCEGCGAEIPGFLDGCPYCDGEEELDATLPCPECGAEIHEDSQRCPVCEAWVTPRLPVRDEGRRWVAILLVLAFVFGGLVMLFRALGWALR